MSDDSKPKLRPEVPVLNGEHQTQTDIQAYVPVPTDGQLLKDILNAAREFHDFPTKLFKAIRAATEWKQEYKAFYEMDITINSYNSMKVPGPEDFEQIGTEDLVKILTHVSKTDPNSPLHRVLGIVATRLQKLGETAK